MNPTNHDYQQILKSLLATPPAEAGDPGGWNVDGWISGTARMLAAGSGFGAGSGYRADTLAGLFETQLQAVIAETYDEQFSGNKAREFFPQAPGIPAGAETVLQRGYTFTGSATLLAGEATDVKRVSLVGAEQTTRIVGLACKWGITQQQLNAAAMAGIPLDAKGMLAAKMVIERDIDGLIANGDATLGIMGAIAMPTKIFPAAGAGVNLYAPAAPVGFTGIWGGAATAAQIMDDVAMLVARFRAGGVFEPTDMLIPSAAYSRIENLIAIAGDTRSVLEVLKSRYPGIRFHHWWRLDTASGATGTGGAGGERVMLYARSKMVIETIVSQEIINLQPVWDGLGYETVSYARCGGVQSASEVAISYAEM